MRVFYGSQKKCHCTPTPVFSAIVSSSPKVNSSQIQRWFATSAADIEPRLHRIKGYRFLKVLRFKLSEKIEAKTGKKVAEVTQELVAAQ